MSEKPDASRRRFLAGAAATAGVAAAGGLSPFRFAIGDTAPVRIGILLPYSGTYAMLGESISNGFEMRIEQAGGRIGGRAVEYIALDSEMSVPKAPTNTNKLIKKEKVDFLIGPVHSGIAAAMARIVGARGTPIMIVPNAGNNDLTGSLCAPNIFRTSFSNWQPAFPGGKVMADDGHETCVTIAWKYRAGAQMMAAGKESFEAHGGKVVKDIQVPFPNVEFQAYLSEIAAVKPDAVFTFFSGGGAVKFVKDYAAAGLKEHIPLYGPGFITEGVSQAQGAAAEGIRTTLHYAADLDNEANLRFRADYERAFGKPANVFAVQGYDTGSLLVQAMAAVEGDTGASEALIAHMEGVQIADSPRGAWRMSRTHNPIQDIYLREVSNGRNLVLGVAAAKLEDPGTGCSMN
jgi:branched-chain amino acid transport system substrate-binding protein